MGERDYLLPVHKKCNVLTFALWCRYIAGMKEYKWPKQLKLWTPNEKKKGDTKTMVVTRNL